MNNSRTLTIKNAKHSGDCFYMNLNIKGDFHICISVALKRDFNTGAFLLSLHNFLEQKAVGL